MGWAGKIIGGAIGLIIGGPLGAVVGGAFGHALDKADEAESAGGDRRFGARQRLSGEQRAEMTFFVGCFSMLAKLCKVDGECSPQERAKVQEFMNRDLKLDPMSRHSAEQLFESALRSQDSFSSFARQFYGQFRSQPQVLHLMMDILVRVAVADGSMSDREEMLIREAAEIFHFSDVQLDSLFTQYSAASDRYYAVLGCHKTSTNDEIKKAYRKLVAEYHPDKVMAKGLPDEFIKVATEKFREIQSAYDLIRKERGF